MLPIAEQRSYQPKKKIDADNELRIPLKPLLAIPYVSISVVFIPLFVSLFIYSLVLNTNLPKRLIDLPNLGEAKFLVYH